MSRKIGTVSTEIALAKDIHLEEINTLGLEETKTFDPFLDRVWIKRRLECDEGAKWLLVKSGSIILAGLSFREVKRWGIVPVAETVAPDQFDYADIIFFQTGYEKESREALVRYIKEDRSRLWLFRTALESSQLMRGMTDLGYPGVVVSERRYDYFDRESWQKNISKRLIKNIKYDIRRLEALDLLEVTVSASPSCECINELLDMKLINLAHKKKKAILNQTDQRSLFVRMHARNSQSKVWRLKSGARTIAMAITLHSGCYVGYQLPAYSLKYSKYGPSNVLLYYIFNGETNLNGQCVVDFMKGGEEYKTRWLPNGIAEKMYLVTNFPTFLVKLALRLRAAIS